MLRKVYFGICMLADIAALVYMAGEQLFSSAAGAGLPLLVDFFLTVLIVTSISVISLKKCIKNEEGRIVFNSILMKLSVIILGLSLSFLAMEDGIYAFVTFLVLGIILSLSTILVAKKKHRIETASSKPTPRTKKKDQEYDYKFKGKWAWDEAAAEYRRLHQIPEGASLTEEQNDLIYEYTITPFSYLFYWLADSGFLSQNFYEEYPDKNFVEEMRNREISPVTVLEDMDYYFGSEYLSGDIIGFFRSYYDTEGQSDGSDNYLSDYNDAIGSPDDRYYCVDFSWDVLDRLTAMIEERYIHRKGVLD